MDITIDYEERLNRIEKQLADYERNFQVLNEHSLYLSECIDKLKQAFDLVNKLLFQEETTESVN